MEKLLLSGNEAIALGAYKAGVLVGTGYPGTPSTEILETLAGRHDVYTEWSINEKVALEVAMGSALSGARSIVTMKHVGLNVAADPLFTSAYIGTKAGLVIADADDPGMHSSQNEQDNRHYAEAAKVPMLEPSDSQEAHDFTILAFELSEKYDTPVIVRTTTRVSHSKSAVISPGKRAAVKPSGFEKNISKYVMVPSNARPRREAVEARMKKIAEAAKKLPINRIEMRSARIGVITSGISYQYVREAVPDASVLKLGMVYPVSHELIREFSKKVKKLFVVEELDPFIEKEAAYAGVKLSKKKLFSGIGELSSQTVRNELSGPARKSAKPLIELPARHPSFCMGCPHTFIFKILSRHGMIVSGDIGCYTLGAMQPYRAMDTCIDMGASVTFAQGIGLAGGNRSHKTVAVIGDSTFAHSGITGLFNAAYNKHATLIIVLDNSTTAMTGSQPNPFSGSTIKGHETHVIDYKRLAEAAGIPDNNFRMVDAYKEADIEKAVLELEATKKLSLLVIEGECVVVKKRMITAHG